MFAHSQACGEVVRIPVGPIPSTSHSYTQRYQYHDENILDSQKRNDSSSYPWFISRVQSFVHPCLNPKLLATTANIFEVKPRMIGRHGIGISVFNTGGESTMMFQVTASRARVMFDDMWWMMSLFWFFRLNFLQLLFC